MDGVDFSVRYFECDYCEKPMTPGNGCTHLTYSTSTGKVIERIPFNDPMGEEFCPDCSVGPGQLHHPFCDYEECAICHDQVIACGHFLDKEDEEDDYYDWEEEEEDF